MYTCPVCRASLAKPATTWAKLDKPDKDYVMKYYTVGTFKCGNCKKVFDRMLSVKIVKLIALSKLVELESSAKSEKVRAEALESELRRLQEENSSLTEQYDMVNSNLKEFQLKTQTLTDELEIAGLDVKAKDLENEVLQLEKERGMLQSRLTRLTTPAV